MTMRIAHVASEVVPFSKSGGLADVAGALPPALAALGHAVTVVAPAHRPTLATPVPGTAVGEVQALGMRATVYEVEHAGVQVLLLDCPQLFVRPSLYAVPDGDFPDNPIRFAFFARAAIEALTQRGGVDVLHVHDWQAALAPLLIRHDPATRTAFPRTKTVITVHNLAYQGLFPTWVMPACGLSWEVFTIDGIEYYGQANFLKGGLVTADAITTVSPTYAAEILTQQFGCGLDGVLGSRRDCLSGILNGLDVDAWDPSRDANLPKKYSTRSVISGKAAARAELVHTAELQAGVRPLAGMVSRLAEQKGADLVAGAVGDLVRQGFDLVILGAGERRYEEQLQAAESAHPGRVRVFRKFDDRLAHIIYAASDVFLMPSRYEPCGLGQMIAMRYGTFPIVTRTGGLADTVVEASEPDGTGFFLTELSPAGLAEACARARAMLDDAKRLAKVRATAMKRDFTWTASARRYESLYLGLLGS